jgi:hypothetical protein
VSPMDSSVLHIGTLVSSLLGHQCPRKYKLKEINNNNKDIRSPVKPRPASESSKSFAFLLEGKSKAATSFPSRTTDGSRFPFQFYRFAVDREGDRDLDNPFPVKEVSHDIARASEARGLLTEASFTKTRSHDMAIENNSLGPLPESKPETQHYSINPSPWEVDDAAFIQRELFITRARNYGAAYWGWHEENLSKKEVKYLKKKINEAMWTIVQQNQDTPEYYELLEELTYSEFFDFIEWRGSIRITWFGCYKAYFRKLVEVIEGAIDLVFDSMPEHNLYVFYRDTILQDCALRVGERRRPSVGLWTFALRWPKTCKVETDFQPVHMKKMPKHKTLHEEVLVLK